MAGLLGRLGIKSYGPAAPPPPEETQTDHGLSRDGWVDMLAQDLPGGDVKGAVLGIDDAFASILALADSSSLRTANQFFAVYKKSSAVAIPINLVAENFAQVHPVLQNLETNEALQVHDLLSLLRRPHALFSRSLFLEAMAKHFLIAGEAPVVGLGAISKPPIMLQPVSPTHLQPAVDMSTGLPDHWKITGRALKGTYSTRPIDMGRQFFDGKDRALKVIRSFSTEDDSLIRGQSKLVSAAKDVWQQIEGSDYNLSLLRQGGRASLIFQFKNAMKPEVFKDRRKLILDQVTGADNAGRVIVTHGGELNITDASASNRDMEYQKGMNAAHNILARTYKVPIVLITTDAATFNNFEKGTLALWDDAISPLAGSILGELGEWLLPLYAMDPNLWMLTYDRMQVDALRSRHLEELKKRRDIGIESFDEIRASVPGLGKVDGGKEILVQGSLTPLSVVAGEIDDVPLPALPIPPSPPSDPDDPEPPPEPEP